MNKKIVSEIAIGIIALFAIVVGLLFWMQGKNEVSYQLPVVKPATNQSAQTDETVDWQIYKNDDNNFEIKYHSFWEPGVFGVEGDLPKALITFDMYNQFDLEQKGNVAPLLGFFIYTQDFDESQDFLGEYYEERKIKESTAKIYKKETSYGNSYSAVLKLMNGNIFLVTVSQIEDSNKSIEILNDILSTFREPMN
ncbi:MAG TPA: hypothetical protein PLB52_02675 [Candidatus Moranbacteria bacterium]|nr:hypothetical protein [Candidatus Moranbacteria bacterium]